MSSKGVATNSSGNSAANRMGKGIPPSSTGSADGPSSSSSSSYRTYGKSKKSWHDDYMRMSETLLLIDCSSICSTSSLNILLSCTKSNRIWVSNTSSAFFSDPDKTYLDSWALSFISMMTELNIKTQKRVSSFKWLPYYGIFSLKELFCKTSIYVSMEICLYRSK